jgi:hypothetical protein
MLFLLPKLIILIFQPACRPLMSTEKDEKKDDEDVSEADEEEELEEGVE